MCRCPHAKVSLHRTWITRASLRQCVRNSSQTTLSLIRIMIFTVTCTIKIWDNQVSVFYQVGLPWFPMSTVWVFPSVVPSLGSDFNPSDIFSILIDLLNCGHCHRWGQHFGTGAASYVLPFTFHSYPICAAEINDLWALARETHKLSQLCFICSVLPYLAVLKVVEVGCLLFCVLAQKKLVSQILDWLANYWG